MAGGGDGGAGEMRQKEEQKQARISQSVDAINSIFNGLAVKQGVNKAAAFDPNAVYYDARGNQVTLPTTANEVSFTLPMNDAARNAAFFGSEQKGTRIEYAPDVQAINRMISNGELFTGVETTPPGTNRESMYSEQKKAVTDLNRREVERQYADAERQNRFALARAGQLGGSLDVDSNAELQRRTNEGLTQAVALGDQAASDLRTSDERTRQSLISMAQSGIDTGTAHQMALSGLNANAQNAASARGGATIGNLFSDLANAYYVNQQTAGRNAGATPNGQWFGVSDPRSGSSGRVQA